MAFSTLKRYANALHSLHVASTSGKQPLFVRFRDGVDENEKSDTSVLALAQSERHLRMRMKVQ